MLCAVEGRFARLPRSAKYAVERTERILCMNLEVHQIAFLYVSVSSAEMPETIPFTVS